MRRMNKYAWVAVAVSLSGLLLGCGDSSQPAEKDAAPAVVQPGAPVVRDPKLILFAPLPAAMESASSATTPTPDPDPD